MEGKGAAGETAEHFTWERGETCDKTRATENVCSSTLCAGHA